MRPPSLRPIFASRAGRGRRQVNVYAAVLLAAVLALVALACTYGLDGVWDAAAGSGVPRMGKCTSEAVVVAEQEARHVPVLYNPRQPCRSAELFPSDPSERHPMPSVDGAGLTAGREAHCSGFATTRRRTAIMLYLGGSKVADTLMHSHWHRYIRNAVDATQAQGSKLDLYLHVRTFSQAAQAHQLKRSLGVGFLSVVVHRETHGSDAGGFLSMLYASRLHCREYAAVLKAHNKGSPESVRGIMDPLAKTSRKVERAVSAILTRPEAPEGGRPYGLVLGSSQRPEVDPCYDSSEREPPSHMYVTWRHGQVESFMQALPHHERLHKQLGFDVPRQDRGFVHDSMYFIAGEVLNVRLPTAELPKLFAEVNDMSTVDWAWYAAMGRLKDVHGPEAARRHYKSVGKPTLHWPSNAQVAHHRPGFMHDGSIEYAWERVLFDLPRSMGLGVAVAYGEKGDTMDIDVLVADAEEGCAQQQARVDYDMCNAGDSTECMWWAFMGECAVDPELRQKCRRACSCMRWDTTGRLFTMNWYRYSSSFSAAVELAGFPKECMEGYNGLRHAHTFQAKERVGHCLWLHSASGHNLVFQPDGDLVLYGPRMERVWATDTAGKGVDYLTVIRPKGGKEPLQLVLLSMDSVVWSALEPGGGERMRQLSKMGWKPSKLPLMKLRLTKLGSIVLSTDDGQIIWTVPGHSLALPQAEQAGEQAGEEGGGGEGDARR